MIATPFIKWAGGKRKLADTILRYAPDVVGDYWEPFLGGGAIFMALAAAKRVSRAHLSDTNADLIATYRVVRDQVTDLIDALELHAAAHLAGEQEYYFTVRGRSPTTDLDRAARLIYLNKTCFNGLYRVNSKGNFNSPRGQYDNPCICDTKRLKLASAALAIAELDVTSFEGIDPREGDFVYCDPPYDGCFINYQANGFNQADQIALGAAVDRWAAGKAKVVVSNADTRLIRRVYQGYNITVVQGEISLASAATSRRKTNELLLSNCAPSLPRQSDLFG